jgi:ferrous iron transport protein A
MSVIGEASRTGFPASLAPEGILLEVVSLAGGMDCRIRLAEMGIVPGARLRVLRRGCPLLVSVGDSRYALGEGLMTKVRVRLSSEVEEASWGKVRAPRWLFGATRSGSVKA